MNQYYPDLNDLSIQPSVERLKHLVETIPAQLRQIPESEFSEKPAPDAWSIKEIIGHLVDSATNNHHRFIRIQYEENPVISYAQDDWVQLSHYQTMDREQLINFWEAYNRLLIHIINNIPAENLTRTGLLKSGEELTLAFYINDYVKHIEHHLFQLFGNLKI